MKENYNNALAKVLVHEGGYSNHPADPGGATMKGVIQRVYDAYRDSKGQPRRSVKNLTNPELQDIYRFQYWNKVHGDDLPTGLDYCVFDAGVNSGPSQAAKWLQRALGVKADGLIGLVTLTAANRQDVDETVSAMCAQRLAMLQRLKTWPTFGKGWGRRVAGVERDALTMTA